MTHVKAEPPNLSPAQKATIYQGASFMAHCGQAQGWVSQKRSADELNNGLVLSANNVGVDVNEFDVGWLGDAGDDGRLRCSAGDDDKIAMKDIGIPGEELFVTGGKIYKPTGDNTGYNLVDDLNDSDRANRLITYVGIKYGLDLTQNLPHAAQYFSLKATFDKQCDGGLNSVSGKSVSFVDDQGNIKTESHLLKDAGTNWPIGFGMDGNAGQDMNCTDIVNNMNSYANDASTAQKDFIAKGGQPPGPSVSGTTPETCESHNGSVVIGWLICTSINALNYAVDTSADVVVNLLSFNSEDFSKDPELKTVWGLFRALASFSLLGVALVMIIGQAVGGE